MDSPEVECYPTQPSLDPKQSHLLEIGPGRGDFLFHLAQQNPDSRIIGVEIKPKRFEKLKVRLAMLGLQNICLCSGDARVVLPTLIPDQLCEKIYILFSDPWPKRRHARNRLFQESFIIELARILQPGGSLFIAHDDPDYRRQMTAEFSKFPTLHYCAEGIDFQTFYAEKWKKAGRNLYSFSYQRVF